MFDVIGWAKELSKKRVAFDGEEVGTAETALRPKRVAASLYAPDVASGQVRRALLDPESQLLSWARRPMRAPRAKVWAPRGVGLSL